MKKGIQEAMNELNEPHIILKVNDDFIVKVGKCVKEERSYLQKVKLEMLLLKNGFSFNSDYT